MVIVSVFIFFLLCIVAGVKIGQIGKLSELLGQFSCKTSENVSKHTMHVCWDIQIAPPRPHTTMLSSLRLVRAPHSDGIPPVNLLVLLMLSPSLSTSSETGSCLGSPPVKQEEHASKHTTHVCWVIQILPPRPIFDKSNVLSFVNISMSDVMVPPNSFPFRSRTSRFEAPPFARRRSISCNGTPADDHAHQNATKLRWILAVVSIRER